MHTKSPRLGKELSLGSECGVPVSHMSVPVMNHVPSTPPSSPEPPSVLPHSSSPVQQDVNKASSFGENPSKALSQVSEMCSEFVPLPLPFQCACCVTRQSMTQTFTGRKDRRTVCVCKNFLMSFPAAASSFTLEPSPAEPGLSKPSQAGSGCRATPGPVGNHIPSAPWLSTPFPNTTWTPLEIPPLSWALALLVYTSLVSAQLCQAGQLFRSCRWKNCKQSV